MSKHVTQQKGKQACKDTMESYPIRDKSTQRERFTLKHKHNIGTDLEAPVVWLLLRGEEKQRVKETEESQGGEEKERESRVRHFLRAAEEKAAGMRKETH